MSCLKLSVMQLILSKEIFQIKRNVPFGFSLYILLHELYVYLVERILIV